MPKALKFRDSPFSRRTLHERFSVILSRCLAYSPVNAAVLTLARMAPPVETIIAFKNLYLTKEFEHIQHLECNFIRILLCTFDYISPGFISQKQAMSLFYPLITELVNAMQLYC